MSSARGAPPRRQKRVSFKEGWEEICIDYNHFSHYHFSDPDCVPLVLQPAHDRNKRPPRPCLIVHNNKNNDKQQADSTEFSAPVAQPIQCGPVSVTIEDKSKNHHGIPQQHGESCISALAKINKPGALSSSTLALINLRPLNPSLSAQQESTLPPQPTAAQQDVASVKDEPPTPFPWESKGCCPSLHEREMATHHLCSGHLMSRLTTNPHLILSHLFSFLSLCYLFH